MQNYKEKYNFLFLDDGLLSMMETALTSAVINWIKDTYDDFLNIHIAYDIQGALEVLNKIDDIDILLTDMNLPPFGIPEEELEKYGHGDFGGFYFIDRLLDVCPDAKIIISSAWNYENYKHLMNDKIYMLLSKPYRFNNLEIIIDDSLQEVIGIETRKLWLEMKNR